MIIKRIIVKEKEFNFLKPVVTSREEISRRVVIEIGLIDENGKCGIGAAYSLPPFTEKSEEVEKKLKVVADSLRMQAFLSLEEFLQNDIWAKINSPLLCFAFETAFINLMIESDDINEISFINKIKSRPVKLNALISETDTHAFLKSAEEAIRQGFDTLKIKLGFSVFENELIRLGFLRTLSDGIKLRIDVNGAWEFEEAKLKVERLLGFNLEYVEDPTACFEDNLKLGALFPEKIAFDQTFNTIEDIQKIAEIKAPLILKPSFFGSISEAVKVIDLFNNAGAKVIISSAFEDAVGREITYALASLLPYDSVHGLNTQSVLIEENTEPYEKTGNRLLFSKEKFLRKNKCGEGE